MFPAAKDYILSLYKSKEDFLFTCADRDVSGNVILQLIGCEIYVSIVKLQEEKQDEEREAKDKITRRYCILFKEHLSQELLCTQN